MMIGGKCGTRCRRGRMGEVARFEVLKRATDFRDYFFAGVESEGPGFGGPFFLAANAASIDLMSSLNRVSRRCNSPLICSESTRLPLV